jgi:hypothetical protein
MQLAKSRTRLDSELGIEVDMLAWPFGIVGDELIAMAEEDGYRAAFTIEGRLLETRASHLALPRFLIVDTDNPAALARRLDEPGTGQVPTARSQS